MNRRLTTLACCLVATATLSAQAPVVKQDFNADGKSDILYFNSTDTSAYELQIFNSSIQLQGYIHTPAAKSWTIAATGLNTKTGISDTFWQNKVTGDVYKMAMNGVGYDPTKSLMVHTELNADWQLVIAADFNNDGQADLMFRNVRTGAIWVKFMNADGTAQGPVDAVTGKPAGKLVYVEPNLDWKPVAVAPVGTVLTGATGLNNLVWYNSVTGVVFMQVFNADGTVNAAASKAIYQATSTDWKLVSADFFDRNGGADLLWWNKVTGDVYVLALNSSFVQQPNSAVIHTADPTKWEIVATGDYNGDGFADLLWRNIDVTAGAATGQLYMMYMNIDGTGKPIVNVSDSVVINVATANWRPVGLTSVSIDAPTVVPDPAGTLNLSAAVDAAATPTQTSYALNTALAVPTIYVTSGEKLPLAARVQGPVKDTTVTWKATKLDNSAPVAGLLTADATFGELFANSSTTVKDVIVTATSSAAPSLSSARKITIVPAPATPVLTPSATTVAFGGSVNLTYSYVATNGEVAYLSDDQGGSYPALGATGSTFTATPAATTNYTLSVKNLANKVVSSKVPVTVTGVIAPLSTVITVNAPAAAITNSRLTASSIYTASVSAETDPNVVIKWTIAGGAILAGQNASQVTFVAPLSGNCTLTCTKTNATTSQSSSNNSTTFIAVPAPTAPTAITVSNEVSVVQGTYLTASKAGQTAVASGATGATSYEWTLNGVVQAATGSTLTFTTPATGNVAISAKALNDAASKSGAFAVSRTSVPLPDGTVTNTSFDGVTGPYVTVGNVNTNINTASVADAGTGATYTWTVTNGTIIAGQGTRSITYFPTCATTQANAANVVSLVATVGNAAGSSTATNPAKTVYVCAAPAGLTVNLTGLSTGTYITNGSAYKYGANVTGFTATSGSGYNDFTYDWSGTKFATIATGTGTKAVTFSAAGVYDSTAAATTTTILKASEVNAAGQKSAAASATSLFAVAAPSIGNFALGNSVTTAGGTGAAGKIAATLSFTGGTGVLIDSQGDAPSTSYPAGTTSGSWTAVTANDLGAGRTLKFRVTNAASDSVEQSLPIDVAALPAGLTAAIKNGDNTAYTTATPVPFGSSFKLTTAFKAPSVTDIGFEGMTGAVTPGNIAVPAASVTYVTPGTGNTRYILTVTNRAGYSGLTTASDTAGTPTNNCVVTVQNPLIAAITFPNANTLLGVGETVQIGGAGVTQATNTVAYFTKSNTGGGSATLSSSLSVGGVNPTITGTAVGAYTINGVPYANLGVADADSKTLSITIGLITIAAPTYASTGTGVLISNAAGAAAVTGANNNTRTFEIVSTSGTGATSIVASTGVVTATTPGTVVVQARSVANTTIVSAPVTVTFVP